MLPAAHDAMGEREHDSRVDARSSLLCAAALVEKGGGGGGGVDVPVAVARGARSPAKTGRGRHAKGEAADDGLLLFAHRIPDAVDAPTLARFAERATGVALEKAPEISRAGDYGKATLVFKSPAHAALAFETLAGAVDDDKAGRAQKKLFLDAAPPAGADGGSAKKKVARLYCKLRRL